MRGFREKTGFVNTTTSYECKQKRAGGGTGAGLRNIYHNVTESHLIGH